MKSEKQKSEKTTNATSNVQGNDLASRPDILKEGETIAERFKVEKKIGQGSFGQIFSGSDLRNKKKVAIKIEPAQTSESIDSNTDPRRLVIEQQVLLKLRKKSNIPSLYASGKNDAKNPYIIMEILGKNLTTLRKERKEAKFSASSAFRIAEQGAYALRYLHEAGYIHRDVKPSNCCIGLDSKSSIVYLVDFGMSRKVIDSDGNWHTSLKNSIFKGTIRYASYNAIKTHCCGPSDDVIGWIYSTIEMAASKLPWAKSTPHDMLDMKEKMSGEEVCEGLPPSLTQCHNYLMSLRIDQMPRYAFIDECLRKCRPEGVKDSDPYDWQNA